MSRARTPALIITVCIVAALLGALLARYVVPRNSATIALQSGTTLIPARPMPTFALVDQDGKPFDNKRILGHWNLLFFGFTNCGDVCPTTLALLAATKKALADLPAAQLPRVVFISVDAKRDTPDSVRTYVRNFDAEFIGVVGTQENLDALTAALGVPSSVRQLENGAVAVDHSAAILAVNPAGKVSAIFTPPHKMDALAADFRALVGSS